MLTALPILISARELDGLIADRAPRIVDASWYLPAQGRSALAEFEKAHIPGAVFFDQDAVVDEASALPHTLPSPERFAAAAGALGLDETRTIIVYDGLGFFSAPRVWWMLKIFGARDVRLLDGGFPAWQAEGLPTENGAARPAAAIFRPSFDASAILSFEAMQGIVESGGMQIADARPGDRFRGEVPEPRPGVRAGHMPGARSLPIGELQTDGRLKSPEELREVFRRSGLDPAAPIVTTCGSGVTAAAINLALASVGAPAAKLYDGSWTEWGAAPDTPVETGPSR